MPRDDDPRTSGEAERPRSEPEIIPPGQDERRRDGFVWTSGDQTGGTHRIYVARPGSFTVILVLVVAALVLAAIVLLLAGLVLFWIPVVILIVAGLLIAGYARYYWARLKIWAAQRLS